MAFLFYPTVRCYNTYCIQDNLKHGKQICLNLCGFGCFCFSIDIELRWSSGVWWFWYL